MADLNLQVVHDTMVELAYEAGQMILAANPADLDTGTKLNCSCIPRTGLHIQKGAIQIVY